MARRRQRIWITRAQPGADATAERVRALGHEAVIAPLLAVHALPDVQIDLGGVAVLAADGDVEALAEGIGQRRGELRGVVLNPSAAEPAGDLVAALERQGVAA